MYRHQGALRQQAEKKLWKWPIFPKYLTEMLKKELCSNKQLKKKERKKEWTESLTFTIRTV